MEQNNHNDTGEYTFVKEKIISKRKKKVKRVLLMTLFTLFLAVIFGLVARGVFLTSNDFLCRLLGIEVASGNEQEREPIVFPSEGPSITITDEAASPTPAMPSPTGTSQENTTPTAAASPTEGVTPEPEGEDGEISPTPTPVIIEQRVDATLDDYIAVLSEMRKLAAQVNTSLLQITTITNGVNWMNEEIEVTEELTGVIMGEDNVSLLILASYDKIQGADRLQVKFTSTVQLEATLFDYDSDYNLAVVAVSLKDIPENIRSTYSIAGLGESGIVYPGMPIIALGSPNGYSGSMEYGFVTSRGSSVYIIDNKIELFNTDITDNENSDGIIVNMRGQLIGIITHTLKEDNNENISTAIGVTKLKPVIIKLLNAEDRIYFGIKGEDMPESVLLERGLENGVYVTEVESNSPAAAAGIRRGDILTSIDDTAISTMDSFGSVISSYSPEEAVKVTVYRKSGSEMTEHVLDAVLQKKMR